jgi:hypothetical protein
MAGTGDARELTLLEAFDIAATDVEEGAMEQVGYEKVDDLTVLERKVIPLITSSKVSDQIMIRVDVYDFNSYTVSSYDVRAGHSDAEALQVRSRNFSEIEGKQCIRDAHRALTELKGSPPPLDEIMNYIMELKNDVSVSTPLKLKTRQQP